MPGARPRRDHAGDTPPFDAAAEAARPERERAAAAELFARLPDDLALRLHDLWEEFEAGSTPEARLAHAADRLEGVLQIVAADGRTWREHGVTPQMSRRRNARARAFDPAFAAAFEALYEAYEGAPTARGERAHISLGS